MLVINEVAAGCYTIPAIDNRRRAGRAMWVAVMQTTERVATLAKLDGTRAIVTFDATGWMEGAAPMQVVPRGANEWIVGSESVPGMLYIVKRVGGQLSCDCPGNYHHGHCKHVARIAATLTPERRELATIGAGLLLGAAAKAR